MELKLEEFFKVNQYGLTHSGYHATQSDGEMARVVALACEGKVWQRHWGIKLGAEGKAVEVFAPHLPPPCYAWLGDYNTGILTPDNVRAMVDLAQQYGAAGAFVLDEDGAPHAVN